MKKVFIEIKSRLTIKDMLSSHSIASRQEHSTFYKQTVTQSMLLKARSKGQLQTFVSMCLYSIQKKLLVWKDPTEINFIAQKLSIKIKSGRKLQSDNVKSTQSGTLN